MDLSLFLHRTSIKSPLKGENMESVYRELIQLIPEKNITNRSDQITQELIKRELEFSTEIKPGISVPHIRLKKIRDIYISVGLSYKGIIIPSAKKPQYLLILELSPLEDSKPHLLIMSEIAKLVKNLSLRTLISQQVTSDQLYSNLIKAYKSIKK